MSNIKKDSTILKSDDRGLSGTAVWKVDFQTSETVGFSSILRLNTGETLILYGISNELSVVFVTSFISRFMW